MTKTERHNIYKKALRVLKKSPTGICLILSDLRPEIDWFKILDFFPEFASKKPLHPYSPNCWWNEDDGGNEKRQEVLKQCIKETAPKKQTA